MEGGGGGRVVSGGGGGGRRRLPSATRKLPTLIFSMWISSMLASTLTCSVPSAFPHASCAASKMRAQARGMNPACTPGPPIMA